MTCICWKMKEKKRNLRVLQHDQADSFQQDSKLLDGTSFVLGLKAPRTSFCGAFGCLGSYWSPNTRVAPSLGWYHYRSRFMMHIWNFSNVISESVFWFVLFSSVSWLHKCNILTPNIPCGLSVLRILIALEGNMATSRKIIFPSRIQSKIREVT